MDLLIKNIRIIGSHPEKAQILTLLRRCAEDLGCDREKPVLILLDGETVIPEGDFYGAVCPMGIDVKGIKNTVCYSTDDFNADIVALNVQEKSEYTCFELMAGDHMGRVFVSNKQGIGVNAVLIVSAALMAYGLKPGDIIEKLNGILKA